MFLKISQNSQESKHLCQSPFLNKFAGLRPATLLKTRLWDRYFPVNFANFLRTPFLIEHLWWLLLHSQINAKNALHKTEFQFCWCYIWNKPCKKSVLSKVKTLISWFWCKLFPPKIYDKGIMQKTLDHIKNV